MYLDRGVVLRDYSPNFFVKKYIKLCSFMVACCD